MSLATVVLPILGRIEDGFQYEPAKKWFYDYWKLSILISAVYVVTVFTLRWYMKNRKPFGLRTPLLMWNTGLAVFSILGAACVVPDFTRNFYTHGMAYGNCNIDGITTHRERFWMLLFCFSKVLELGDTMFIVLRKSPLSFLHWYHHLTVLMYSWYAYGEVHEIGMWFCGMNYFIHTIMYSYYALRASGLRLPSAISQVITLLQIAQMITGIIINVMSLQKYDSFDCIVRYDLAFIGLAIYTSYMILFGNFFYHRYIRKVK